MTLRDLGYRPYEGERHSAAHSSRVLFRHGLRRAWASPLVKIVTFVVWIPTAVAITIIGFEFFISTQAPDPSGYAMIDAGSRVHTLMQWQLWFFVFLIALGAGANVIAEDLGQGGFPYYFSKPVSAEHYLVGRVGAIAWWSFLITWIPAILVVLALVGTAPENLRLERLGLIFPALLYASLLSTAVAAVSVGTSALSKSSALTRGTWILLFVGPYILARIVEGIGEWPWLDLASLPALLSTVGQSLFKVENESPLTWMHALPILVIFMGAAIAFAYRRLTGTKVIA